MHDVIDITDIAEFTDNRTGDPLFRHAGGADRIDQRGRLVQSGADVVGVVGRLALHAGLAGEAKTTKNMKNIRSGAVSNLPLTSCGSIPSTRLARATSSTRCLQARSGAATGMSGTSSASAACCRASGAAGRAARGECPVQIEAKVGAHLHDGAESGATAPQC